MYHCMVNSSGNYVVLTKYFCIITGFLKQEISIFSSIAYLPFVSLVVKGRRGTGADPGFEKGGGAGGSGSEFLGIFRPI